MSEKDKAVSNPSRRNFVKTGAALAGTAIVGGIVGNLIGGKQVVEKETEKVVEQSVQYTSAMMFFTDPNDLKVIEAAAERIYPETEEGPGAKALGVAYYIDHQLAGAWGNNVKEYHVGPFYETEAVPEQGYQTRMKRNEVFVSGIELLRNEAQSRYQKKFDELAKEEQIAILQDVEADKVKLHGTAPASYFFRLLKQATIEGVYADPMYGGNKDMQGWKMKKYPGANTSQYAKVVDQDKFVEIQPESLNKHMM
ncbi:gluconate 2-dehydrogenase subunit 3 family protein [Brevibacillus fulvus]|uniref:Gluconate 2-dehydrogenase gamma chain n=1 Tax=Brevibacillus fulvus TaxID=1125967 RepID=A0A938XZK9_9BACL|nr:gluconate 2-dehydrogenase subunit 3 family protein [Brevibacillus fulvus]MBM7590488.1 gluconate 2-dehydrogenase gamma chain [Brevibacillus fulvus]